MYVNLFAMSILFNSNGYYESEPASCSKAKSFRPIYIGCGSKLGYSSFNRNREASE